VKRVLRLIQGLTWKGVLGVTGLSLVMSAACAAQGLDSAVSGVVRDAKGTPQMGALVELLRADASVVVSTLTDTHGRYILPSVFPGRYELRATAAFFVPTRRSDLRLHAGTQAVVNLTMNSLFEAENWLPAQRRRSDEPADDWKWTLRSTANRPLLRLYDPQAGMEVSSSTERAPAASTQGQVALINGDGAFSDGGMHQVVVLNRTVEGGDGMVLRADFGEPQTGLVGPSINVSTGYERRSAMGGATRLVTSYQSHPELTDGFNPGLQVMQVASTEQLALGDAVLIDVGTLLEAEQLQATRLASEPYLRVSLKPGSDVVVEYRMATGRELQSSSDLDRLSMRMNALSDANGRPLLNTGRHQEISVSRKLNKTVVSVAVFSDRFDRGALAGSGLLSRTELQGSSMIEDPTTGTFHLAMAGYSGRGLSGSVMQPLTPSLSLWGEYDLGTALTINPGGDGTPTLAELQSNLSAHTTQAASAAVRGKILRSGTSMKAEYRWQPVRSLTQVNAYNTTEEEAYLSFYLRQRLHCGRLLPQGLDAVVEATNLLEQGYQPVLAPDGHTLFLAQIPRAVQGGLAFNF
jgi:hypothetical protein